MSSKIDQKDINNAAWAACDTFRGVVDPGAVQRLHPRDAVFKIHL